MLQFYWGLVLASLCGIATAAIKFRPVFDRLYKTLRPLLTHLVGGISGFIVGIDYCLFFPVRRTLWLAMDASIGMFAILVAFPFFAHLADAIDRKDHRSDD